MNKFSTFLTRFKRVGTGASSQPSSQQPARRASSFPYEGATTGRRLGTWATTRDAVNSVWYQSADQLVARSRDMARKDGWAAKAIDEWVCNAIGNGIKPQSLHPTQATKEKIQKLWSQFAGECDASGTTDIYGFEALAFRSMVEGGECFVRKHVRPIEAGLAVPLQLQLMETEQLPFYLARPTPDTPRGNVVRASIEFDPDGRRTAYYFYREHPGERLLFPAGMDLLRIPAGEVMHLFRPMRPGQLRGIPWLANALVRLWELDQYDDAELLRKKFAAMMMAFITRQNPEDPFFGNEQTSAQATSAGGATPDSEPGVQVAQLEAGTMMDLEPGEDVKFTEPADVGGNYEAFERQTLLRIGAGLGLPYDMLTGDLSQTSYSSIRAGILSFRRLCEQIQYGVFVFQFCRPTWQAFIEAAVLAGQLDARDYQANRLDYLAVEWHTPKWAWVDPEKDVKGEIMAIRAGLKSRSMSINEAGMDEEDVDRQIARDNERADELGLVLDSDPRNTAPPGGGGSGGAARGSDTGGDNAGEGKPPAKRTPKTPSKRGEESLKEVIQ
ncbi:MAG: phage portal protein [Candidatus Solibacter sp.]|nr:phage portal protein [Candidatus Solibacter sp.]